VSATRRDKLATWHASRQRTEADSTPVQVVYPQTRLMSNKVRTFVDECVAKLRRVGLD
jgi:uncharacterized protein